MEFLVSMDVQGGTASVEKEYKITVTKYSFAKEVFIKHYRYKCLLDLICSEDPLSESEPNIRSSFHEV